jgi:hypothetical protein
MPLTDKELIASLSEAIRAHSKAQPESSRAIYASDRKSLAVMREIVDANERLYDTYNTLIGLWNQS